MPNLPLEIQDLISRLLTVDPNDRITISGIKSHPAFHYGLPTLYKVPTPLPLPFIDGPIDIESVDPTLYQILQSIGYKSESDIKLELTKPGQQMAKVFYSMFIRLVSLHSLPWADSGNSISQVPDDAFLMSPKPMPMINSNGLRPANQGGKSQNPPYESTPIDIQSFAQKSEWAEFPQNPQNQREEEQQLQGLPVHLPLYIKNTKLFT